MGPGKQRLKAAEAGSQKTFVITFSIQPENLLPKDCLRAWLKTLNKKYQLANLPGRFLNNIRNEAGIKDALKPLMDLPYPFPR